MRCFERLRNEIGQLTAVHTCGRREELSIHVLLCPPLLECSCIDQPSHYRAIPTGLADSVQSENIFGRGKSS